MAKSNSLVNSYSDYDCFCRSPGWTGYATDISLNRETNVERDIKPGEARIKQSFTVMSRR